MQQRSESISYLDDRTKSTNVDNDFVYHLALLDNVFRMYVEIVIIIFNILFCVYKNKFIHGTLF